VFVLLSVKEFGGGAYLQHMMMKTRLMMIGGCHKEFRVKVVLI
jgi:hypothetical protein